MGAAELRRLWDALLPRLGNAHSGSTLSPGGDLRGPDSSPVAAPGSPNPGHLLVIVTALLASLPPTSGHLHRSSHCALSQPFSEAHGPLNIWPATPGPPGTACPQGGGLRASWAPGQPDRAQPGPARTQDLLCLQPASAFLWWSQAPLQPSVLPGQRRRGRVPQTCDPLSVGPSSAARRAL